MKPHLRLHVTKHQKDWWIGFSYPWDRDYTAASTMNYGDPWSACIAARSMCMRLQADCDRMMRTTRAAHFGYTP